MVSLVLLPFKIIIWIIASPFKLLTWLIKKVGVLFGYLIAITIGFVGVAYVFMVGSFFITSPIFWIVVVCSIILYFLISLIFVGLDHKKKDNETQNK
tara:strand:- start:84 stop:374 length:291 start_codon:yes stop_codon:yes gene_type:complete